MKYRERSSYVIQYEKELKDENIIIYYLHI
jgi:hypothetical protein